MRGLGNWMAMPEDVVLINKQGSSYPLPPSLIDAISDIQQYADAIESKGQTQIPEGFLTLKRRLAYLNIGFVYGLGDSIILWVISPFMYAVLFDLLPIFGRYEPNLFDKAFALILSKYVTVGLLSTMIYLLTRIRGSLTRGCVSSLVGGYATALFVRAVVFLLVYRWLYKVWPSITEKLNEIGDQVLATADSLAPEWSKTPLPGLLEGLGDGLISFADWLEKIRPIILTASNYETIFAVVIILILLVTWVVFGLWRRAVNNPYYERFAKR